MSDKKEKHSEKSHRRRRVTDDDLNDLAYDTLLRFRKTMAPADDTHRPINDRGAEKKKDEDYLQPDEKGADAIGHNVVEIVLGPYRFRKSKSSGVCNVTMRRTIKPDLTAEGTATTNSYKESDEEYAKIFAISGVASDSQMIEADVFENAVNVHNDLCTRSNFVTLADDYNKHYIAYIGVTQEIARLSKLKDQEVQKYGVKSSVAKACEVQLKALRDKKYEFETKKEYAPLIQKQMVANAGINQALLRRGMLDTPIQDIPVVPGSGAAPGAKLPGA